VPPDLGPWDPLSPAAVYGLFSAAAELGRPLTWWLAGGHALDLFVGRPTRSHDDIDVSIFRMDAPLLPSILLGWDLHLAHHGVLTPWDAGPLQPPCNSIWGRPDPAAPWSLQVMLEEGTAGYWVCRRHPDLVVPMGQAVRISPVGLPYVAPQIQLLMKAKGTRPKDDADFALVFPLLNADDAAWLIAALRRHYPGHHWLAPAP
jgi:Aminoglycoside-2''-adenylyltransferase